MNPTVYPDIPSRLQRQFHVTGTQYIRTDKVQSKTLNTGGTAERYFRPVLERIGVVTVHTPLSREVFWHENAKIPRHTARIYAISINSVHREACY